MNLPVLRRTWSRVSNFELCTSWACWIYFDWHIALLTKNWAFLCTYVIGSLEAFLHPISGCVYSHFISSLILVAEIASCSAWSIGGIPHFLLGPWILPWLLREGCPHLLFRAIAVRCRGIGHQAEVVHYQNGLPAPVLVPHNLHIAFRLIAD